MYWQREVIAGNTIEVKRYHSAKAMPKYLSRRQRTKQTSVSQEEVNRKNSEDMLRWLINTNFGYGDYHIVLNYRHEAGKQKNFEEIKADVKCFIRNVRKRYAHEGKEMKYVYVFEVGERGARHTHMVINGLDLKKLQDCWKFGRITCTPLDKSGDYKRLASYLMKYSDKTFRNVGAALKARYSRSRNLKLPIIKKTKVKKADSFKKSPTTKKGYEIVSDSVELGVDIFGYAFLKYTMVKLE